MEALIKSDIFFFITGVAVIAVAIGIVIALYYLIKILRDVEEIADNVKDESKMIIKDIGSIRKGVKRSGKKAAKIISDKLSQSSGTKKHK